MLQRQLLSGARDRFEILQDLRGPEGELLGEDGEEGSDEQFCAALDSVVQTMENCKAAHDSGDAIAFMEGVRHTLRVLDDAHAIGVACQKKRAVELERRRERERREIERIQEEKRRMKAAEKKKELGREAEERRKMRREEEFMIALLEQERQAQLRAEEMERQVCHIVLLIPIPMVGDFLLSVLLSILSILFMLFKDFLF